MTGSGATLEAIPGAMKEACLPGGAIKLALSLLHAEPAPLWSDEEYLELPRKFEMVDGELLVTF